MWMSSGTLMRGYHTILNVSAIFIVGMGESPVEN